MRSTILVLSASLSFPASVFAETLTNAFVVASGDGLRFVDGRDFAVTGAVGAAGVSLAPNPGWRLLTPPEISVSPGGAVAYRVRSLLGEDEGGGAVTNEVPEAALHLEPPTISASVDADVPYVYTQPQTEMSNIVFRLDGVCDTPGRHGIEGQEPYDHLTPTHWTWEWSFGADTGVVHGVSAEVGPFVRTKGAYDFTATLMASNSACPECAVSTNLVRQIVVSELILSGNPWIGQDRTGDPDAQQDYPMFSYSASLDPANPDVDHIEMDYDGVCDTVVNYGTEIHAWCTNRELSSVSYTNEVFTAVAIPKTNSVPSRLRMRSAGRGGTLRDANGGATPAQANRRGTVQKVDVTIGSWTSKEEEEANEESRGSYVLYKEGIPTVADMSFLTPVTFSCAPDNLPPNAPIRITHSGRGTLYMKVAESEVLTPVTSFPTSVSNLDGQNFYLHGSTVSSDVSDCSIRIEHPESGAVDEARYSIIQIDVQGFSAWRRNQDDPVPDYEEYNPGFLVTVVNTGREDAKLRFRSVMGNTNRIKRYYRCSVAGLLKSGNTVMSTDKYEISGDISRNHDLVVNMTDPETWGSYTFVDVEYSVELLDGTVLGTDICRLLRPYVVSIGDSLTYGLMRTATGEFLTPRWDRPWRGYPSQHHWDNLQEPYNNYDNRLNISFQGYRGYLASLLPGFTWLGVDSQEHGPPHNGFPGAKITQIVGRLNLSNLELDPSFEIVIFLGGMNDCNRKVVVSVSEDWQRAMTQLKTSREGKGRTILIGAKVPDVAETYGRFFDHVNTINQNIHSLNAAISNYSSSIPYVKFVVANTGNIAHDDGDDGMHFLSTGYQNMANELFNAVLEGIQDE